MNAPKYTLTNESISIVGSDGKMHNIRKGQPNFLVVRDALLAEDWEKAMGSLEIKGTVKSWAKGRFTFSADGEHLLYDGKEVERDLNNRVMEMVRKNEDPTPLFNFFERLQKNPSWRSVQQLFKFLNHDGISFLPDGCFLAYKGVRMDYKDAHSGTVDNSPGKTHQMPRNQISDDPREACHVGFHVGALSYAQSFSERVVVCKVDPADVVSVPYDESERKVRVCKYTVVGNYGEQLPSTIYTDELPSIKEEVSAPTCGKCKKFMVNAGQVEGENGPETHWICENKECQQTHRTAAAPAQDTLLENGEEWTDSKGDNAEVYRNLKPAELMEKPLGDLRSYAARVLKIVGASKIPGGKTMLIAKILGTEL